MKLAAVILNYNDSVNASNLALKLSTFNEIDIVVVVDNCSTDDSLTVMKRMLSGFKKINLYVSEKNGGYSYGNNFGIKKAQELGCDKAIVCNTDVEFDNTFINECCNALDTQFAVVSVLMKMPGDIYPYEDNYRIFSYSEDLLTCFHFGRKYLRKKYNRKLVLNNNDHQIHSVDKVPGSMFFIDINKFFECGGFDENVFLYCEERILGRKVKNKGYKVGVYYCYEYFHNHSISIDKSMSKLNQYILTYKSRLYYQKAYNSISPFKAAVFKLCVRFFIMEYHIIRMIKSK